MESRKMVKINLFAKQKERHSCREQCIDTNGGKRGWDDL